MEAACFQWLTLEEYDRRRRRCTRHLCWRTSAAERHRAMRPKSPRPAAFRRLLDRCPDYGSRSVGAPVSAVPCSAGPQRRKPAAAGNEADADAAPLEMKHLRQPPSDEDIEWRVNCGAVPTGPLMVACPRLDGRRRGRFASPGD